MADPYDNYWRDCPTVNHNCKGDKAARKLARAAERANMAKARAEYEARVQRERETMERRPVGTRTLSLLSIIAALGGSRG